MMRHNNSQAWFLGIDLGTGSCKSTIIDEHATALGLGSCNYSKEGAGDGRQEQDPQSLESAAIISAQSAIRSAGVSPHRCQGISLGGAMHSLMAVDSSDRPLTGLMTWVDSRAIRQAKVVREAGRAGELYEATGCPVHSIYPLFKIIWLREEHPEVFKRAVRFISGKEWVTHRLTGSYLADYSIASGSGMLNVHSLKWNGASLELAGITPDRLSTICSPRHVVPGLRPQLAGELGIPAGTPLVVGSSDAVNSSLGAGAVLQSQATCMIGTSGALRVFTPHPMLDSSARSWCYAVDEGRWLVGGALNNGGLALTWFRDLINGIRQLASEKKQVSFEDLIEQAGEVEAGAGGLLCLPFFAGERSPNWNLNARAVFFGLTLGHEARHVARALLEGVAFRLRSLQDVLLELGIPIVRVHASGGFTQSPVWPEIVASVLNRELAAPEWGETSSLGAALWGLMGAGVVGDLEEIARMIPIGDRYHPDARDSERYNRLYPLYLDLYEKLRGSFDKLAAFGESCVGA
jgi:gluconokinase